MFTLENFWNFRVMRSKKNKLFKKYVVLSFAAIMLTTGASYGVDQVWSDVKDQSVAGDITINNDITTDGTALKLGAPPVPGGSININGNGHTITAAAGADSFIINNDVSAVTNIKNTNFTGGDVTTMGGAIQNAATLKVEGTDGNKSTFTGNSASNGGAISNSGIGTVVLDNTAFDGNSAVSATEGYGGAIYNNSSNTGTSLVVRNSAFTNNTARSTGSGFGGAIANFKGKAEIHSSTFTSNNAQSEGGAILNHDIMTIDNTVFSKNTADSSGGAIVNGIGESADPGAGQDGTLTITNTLFDNNYADVTGGAISNTPNTDNRVNTLIIGEGTSFINNGYKLDPIGGNKVTISGGAIYNAGKTTNAADVNDAVLKIEGTSSSRVQFVNNIARTNGGAVFNEGKATISNADFVSNGTNSALAAGTKTANGGAIMNRSSTAGTDGKTAGELTVANSNFVNNRATRGGAVYNASKATFIDSDFSGNKADSTAAGGAIYATAGSSTTIMAKNKDVFIGNATSVVDNTDSIVLVGTKDAANVITKATADFQASGGRTINLNSMVIGSVSSDAAKDILADVNINKIGADGTAYDGTVRVNGDAKIQNSNINLYSGQLAFAHDRNLDSSNILNMYGGTLNLLNNEFGAYQMQAKELNLLGNSNIMVDVDLKNEKMDSILSSNFGNITNPGGSILNVSAMKSITDTIGDSAKVLFTDHPELIGHVTSNGSSQIEGPINKYSVSQITQNTGGNPMGDNGEYFMFNKIGNSDSIIAGPVAAQAAFLMMDNIYRQSFANMDMVTLMTPEQRMAWKMRNKYASSYHTGVYAPNVLPEERDGFYVRPFTNFENVPLKNGPKVSNVSYGTLIGGDSDLVELGHGWDGNFSFFGAYQGSRQTYNGVGIWQNGGSLGGVATAYKGNFWTGVTANIGASAAEANTMFGNDQFPILMTGAAWKSGYNWGLLSNKLIIQPNYMMSYTFVNVFDYTNSSGVKVTQDPLNAIEIIPGLRIIGNLKNGWQPYLGFSMTWNVMDKTKFYANEVALTQLSVKPYFEYGVGLQKRYGDRFTGFGQAMLRSGGRNGIALTMGLRWALGH